MANPWFQQFTPNPARTFYVAVTAMGNGGGTTEGHAKPILSAMQTAQPGDLYLCSDIAGPYQGLLNFGQTGLGTGNTRFGTVNNPIVWRSVDSDSSTRKHAFCNGKIRVGQYNWVWGWHCEDPTLVVAGGQQQGLSIDGMYQLHGPGTRMINCSAMGDMPATTGGRTNAVGAFTRPDATGHAWRTVIYGNTIWKGRHNLYTQNDYPADGYKYVIANIIQDPSSSMGQSPDNMQTYGAQGKASGYYIKNNFFHTDKNDNQGTFDASGATIILGAANNEPNTDFVFDSNVVSGSLCNMGWSEPSQHQFTSNHLHGPGLFAKHWWGEGDAVYTKTKPIIVTDNDFVAQYPGSLGGYTAASIVTMRFSAPGVEETGICQFTPDDYMDYNRYYYSPTVPLKWNITAGGGAQQIVTTIANWRAVTATWGGHALDVNSTVAAAPTTTYTNIVQNEYDCKQLNLAVINYGLLTNVSVNLNQYIPQGSAFWLYDAKDSFDNPIVSGTYSGAFNIPMGGVQWGAYIIRMKEDPLIEDCVIWLAELKKYRDGMYARGTCSMKLKRAREELDILIDNIQKRLDGNLWINLGGFNKQGVK